MCQKCVNRYRDIDAKVPKLFLQKCKIWIFQKYRKQYNICRESFQTVRKHSRHCGKFPDSLETFQTVQKIFRQYKKFLDSVESFRTVWKVLDSLENFQTVWKVSGQSGKFPDSLVFCWTIWKAFNQSEKFLDSLESFWTIWKVYNQFANARGTGCFFVTVGSPKGRHQKKNCFFSEKLRKGGRGVSPNPKFPSQKKLRFF